LSPSAAVQDVQANLACIQMRSASIECRAYSVDDDESPDKQLADCIVGGRREGRRRHGLATATIA
jgi:hypothetical protein